MGKEFHPKNIDRTRTQLNYSLHDDLTPEKIAVKLTNMAAESGVIKFRKNQIVGLEIIFSLPTTRLNQNNSSFFLDCYIWAYKRFNGIFASFDVHLDESAPHAHAIIFPLLDGKMQGSNMLGGKGNIKMIVDDFHEKVACLHGMSKPVKLSKSCLMGIDKKVMRSIANDPVKRSAIWHPIRDAIRKNPLPYAQQLGITYKKSTKPKRAKSFLQIMTSKGKGSYWHDDKEFKQAGHAESLKQPSNIKSKPFKGK